MAVSYDGEGHHPLPVAFYCDDCGDTWRRPAADENFASGGARYFIGGRWLCTDCHVGRSRLK